MNTHDIELPPLAGTLAMLPDHHKKVVESYGLACAYVAIEADRQRRGEPVAFEIRFGTTMPASVELTPFPARAAEARALGLEVHGLVRQDDAPQPAEPVKVPSDESLDDLADEFLWDTHAGRRALIRAALARYGAQPASIIEQIAQQWDGCVYEAAGAGDLDIGEAIRTAAHRLRAQPAASAEPDDRMTAIARRNLRAFLGKASFAVNVDRQAALNCLEVLEQAIDAAPTPPADNHGQQPTPPQVRCNHCGWTGEDADLVRDVAADEPDDGAADVCPECRRIGDLMDLPRP